ncbi:MAG: hypothetical protein V1853_04725, partial [bacterium]
MKKSLIIIIVLVVAAGVVFFMIVEPKRDTTETTETNVTANTATEASPIQLEGRPEANTNTSVTRTTNSNANHEDTTQEETDTPSTGSSQSIIFLHHSTGGNIWDGGVSDWFDEYNNANDTSYAITDQEFPKDSPYGWENYPYDYWNIWVNHAG